MTEDVSMSAMEVADAHEMKLEMYDLRANIENSIYMMGLKLLKVKEAGYYRAYGFDTVYEFTAAPLESGGLGIGSRTASRWMRLAQFYIIDRQVPMDMLKEAGAVKMDMMVDVISNKEKEVQADTLAGTQQKKRNIIDRVIDDARAMSGVDLLKKYKGQDMSDVVKAGHRKLNNVTCPHCGKLYGGPREQEAIEADFTVHDDSEGGRPGMFGQGDPRQPGPGQPSVS